MPDVDRELRSVLVYAYTSGYANATKEEMESEDAKALFKLNSEFWRESHTQMSNAQWVTMQQAKKEHACPCVRCGLGLPMHFRYNGVDKRCGCRGNVPIAHDHPHRPIIDL